MRLRSFTIACFVIFCLLVVTVIVWFATAPRSSEILQSLLIERLNQQSQIDDAKMQPPTFYLNIAKRRLELEITQLQMQVNDASLSAQTLKLALPVYNLLKFSPVYEGIYLEQLSLALPDNVENPLLIPSFRLHPSVEDNQRDAFAIELVRAEGSAAINGYVISSKKRVNLEATLQDVPASILALLDKTLEGLTADIDGTLTMQIKKNLKLEAFSLNARTDNIRFVHPVYYPKKPLLIDSLNLLANWNSQNHLLKLEEAVIRKKEAIIKATGEMNTMNQVGMLEVSIKNLPVNRLERLWPISIGETARQWVTKRIRDGMINKGKAFITQHPQQEVPELEAALNLENITVLYADHLPPALEANGIARFTADSMVIEVEKAKALTASVVEKAEVAIPSFTQGAIPMHIHLPIKASAQDVVTYLSEPHLNKGGELALRPESISGEVEGEITLNFPLYPEKEGLGHDSFDHLVFTIDAKLKDVSQSGVLNEWDIEKLNGNVSVDNTKISLKAKTQLQQVAAMLDVVYHHASADDKTIYDVELLLPEHKLATFEVPIPAEYVHGNTLLKANIQEDSVGKNIKASLDFKDALLQIPLLRWQKPDGAPAILKVQQRIAQDVNHIESLEFASEDTNIKGSLMLDEDGNIREASLPEITSPQMQLALRYEQEGKRPFISLKGSRLSLDVIQAEEEKEQTSQQTSEIKQDPIDNPFHDLLNKKIEVDVSQVVFPKGELRGLKISSDCGVDACPYFKAEASYQEKERLEIAIRQEDSLARTLYATISDVGLLLTLMDMEETLSGGELSLNGNYLDEQKGKPLNAKMRIHDLTVQDVPALSKLLTLASLRGIADTLGGNGIAFDKISGDFTYNGRTVALEKFSAKGDAMGIMAEGRIRPYGMDDVVDIEGTLIPSYTLNSLPGKVPVIGELLVGGKDEGIFGTRFSVRGDLDDPTIIVNPLSMLTPGFLRNIFDAFPDVQPVDAE